MFSFPINSFMKTDNEASRVSNSISKIKEIICKRGTLDRLPILPSYLVTDLTIPGIPVGDRTGVE
jgi:hypothetical protein